MALAHSSAGLEIAWINGILQGIYASDFTKISVLIGLVLAWQSFACAAHMWNQTQKYKPYKDAEETLERGWMWSDIVLSLGMIGTVIGFMMMLAGFVDVDFSDFDSVQALITKLSGWHGYIIINYTCRTCCKRYVKASIFWS